MIVVVIKIIKNFVDKNIWLSQGLNNAELLAQFGESQKLCEFLLEQVVASGGFRAQHNALSVLCEFSNFLSVLLIFSVNLFFTPIDISNVFLQVINKYVCWFYLTCAKNSAYVFLTP